MQVAIPSGMLTIDNFAKFPPRTYLAPDVSATLEFGSQIGCSTFDPPLWVTGVTLKLPSVGTLSLTGVMLNAMCGPPIILAFQS